jgi:hypothetical protein
MNYRQSSRRARAASAGHVAPSAMSMSGAPLRPGRSRARARSACRRPSAVWMRSWRSNAQQTGPMSTTGRMVVRRTAGGCGRHRSPTRHPTRRRGKINLTDLDSRNGKTRGGYLQGYNAQAAVTAGQIVIAAEISVSSPDFGLLGPVMDAAVSELADIGVTDMPGVLVADTGYWHQVQMDQIVEHGTQVLIPPDAGNRTIPWPGWDGGLYAFMRRVLATQLGGDLYRKRKGMIEPVFANTKFNRGIDRFQRRGRSAVRSEWRLITATHNLLKLHTHQLAIAAP